MAGGRDQARPMHYVESLWAALMAGSPTEKGRALQAVELPPEGACWAVPELPPRPGRAPGTVERSKPARRRRGLENPAGRRTFLHAIYHIELSAIDLAVAQCLRGSGMPRAYHADFLQVAREEVEHAGWLDALLTQRGSPPGHIPVHFALWDTARLARDPGEQMVLIPRFLEARGLDVTAEILPRMLEVDPEAHAVLLRIYEEEIGHVAIGSRWHRYWCAQHGMDVLVHLFQVMQERCPDSWRPVHDLDRSGRRLAGFSEPELDALEAARAKPLTGDVAKLPATRAGGPGAE